MCGCALHSFRFFYYTSRTCRPLGCYSSTGCADLVVLKPRGLWACVCWDVQVWVHTERCNLLVWSSYSWVTCSTSWNWLQLIEQAMNYKLEKALKMVVVFTGRERNKKSKWSLAWSPCIAMWNEKLLQVRKSMLKECRAAAVLGELLFWTGCALCWKCTHSALGFPYLIF